MDKHIESILSNLKISKLKTYDDLITMNKKSRIDIDKILKQRTDNGDEFHTNKKLLKQFMGRQVNVAYNIKEDQTHNGIKYITIISYDKEVEDSVTVKELAKIIEKGFDDVNNRLDGVDKHLENVDNRLDGVDKRLDNVDKRLDNVEKRLDNVEKRLDNVEKRLDDVNDRIDNLENNVNKRFDDVNKRIDNLVWKNNLEE